MQLAGVHAFVGAEDVPGSNMISLFGGEAQIFAQGTTGFVGQPLGLIVADNTRLARQAAALVEVSYSDAKARL